jgi:hypothetical protein
VATAVTQRVRNTPAGQLRDVAEVLKTGVTTDDQTERLTSDDHRVGKPCAVVEHNVINLELPWRSLLLQSL